MTDTYRVHCECEKCDIHFSFETENYQLSEEAGGPDLEVYCPLCTQPAIVVDKEDIPYEDDNPQAPPPGETPGPDPGAGKIMKICPFMSGTLKKSVKHDPAHYAPTVWDEPNFIDCIEDRCMAWAPAFTIPAMIERIGNAIHHIPPEHREGCCKIIAR